MNLPDNSPHHETEPSRESENSTKPIDFAVDSAGNVSPLTRRKAESLAGRAPPPQGRWPRSG